MPIYTESSIIATLPHGFVRFLKYRKVYNEYIQSFITSSRDSFDRIGYIKTCHNIKWSNILDISFYWDSSPSKSKMWYNLYKELKDCEDNGEVYSNYCFNLKRIEII